MASVHLGVLLVLFLGIDFRESVAQERGHRGLSSPYLNEEEFAQVKANTVDPSQVMQLSWHPRVFLYRRFLSAEECEHLISLALEKSNTSVDADGSPRNETRSIRVDRKDEITRRIEEQILAWTFLRLDNSKGLQVQHFWLENSNMDYRYFDPKLVEQGITESELSFVKTVHHHLKLPWQNKAWLGCTENGDILHPERGNAILFFNLNLNASPDPSSSHARCPILEGELWFATNFLYVKQLKQETNLPLSNEDDCTDEDENCASWAASGECGKNPVFMVGSPDYYGTCRKSCKACSL